MIYSRHPVYSKKIAPVFFRYLTVQMMVVQQSDDGVWVPAQNPKKEPGAEKTCMLPLSVNHTNSSADSVLHGA